MPLHARSRSTLAALSLAALAALSSACSSSEPRVVVDCAYAGGLGAPSTCLAPTMSPEHYVQQAHAYFDTLDTAADRASVPTYSELVARWEWPPWLKLTGYTRQTMIDTDKLVLQGTPSTVPERDCRAFAVQPFARCHVVFHYAEGACAIYEEFTFDDQGEMTFIEAWSESATAPGNASDRWAEGASVHRLSTKVPGLGSANGRIDPNADWMTAVAAQDPEIADFATRAKDFWGTWMQELQDNGNDVMARGCGWPVP